MRLDASFCLSDYAFVVDRAVDCGLSVDVGKLGGVTMGMDGGEEKGGGLEALGRAGGRDAVTRW